MTYSNSDRLTGAATRLVVACRVDDLRFFLMFLGGHDSIVVVTALVR